MTGLDRRRSDRDGVPRSTGYHHRQTAGQTRPARWFMVRRHITALRLGLMSADASSAIALFILVSIFRFGPSAGRDMGPAGIDGRAPRGPLRRRLDRVLWLFGLYRLRVRWSARTEVVDVARGPPAARRRDLRRSSSG